MKEGERIDDMFGRMQILLNGLKALKQSFSKAQINLKLLDSMSKIWKPKTMTITRAHDLRKLTWDGLIEILRVHEVHLQEEVRKKLQPRLTELFKFVSTKRKETKALKKKR